MNDLTRLRAIMRRYRRVEAIRAERDREIAELVDRGVPRESICRIVELTREQVRRIADAERKRRTTPPTGEPDGTVATE